MPSIAGVAGFWNQICQGWGESEYIYIKLLFIVSVNS